MILNAHQLVEAMNKGFETLKWSRLAYLRDKEGIRLTTFEPGKHLRIDDGITAEPCSACAVGAMMIASKLPLHDILSSISRTGHNPDTVFSLNDGAPNQATAITNVTEYLLS